MRFAMSRFQCCVALGTALLAAGCAVAPEEKTENGLSADTAAAVAPEAIATTRSADEARGVAATPNPVVDLNEQPPTAHSEVICRQMLKPNSNVIINVCGTRPEWKEYDRREALVAKDLLLRMQNGTFR